MATARDSVNYAAIHTNRYLADARKEGGRIVPLPFEVTVVSTSATNDTYNLTVIPANARVVQLICTTDGIGASAGAGRTFQVGDSGDDDRYMVASDFDVANAQGSLAMTGAGYTPAADTIVVGKFVNAPVVGKKVTGTLFVIPGA
jgi:hypothetical protein